jgi:hypothetical protein
MHSADEELLRSNFYWHLGRSTTENELSAVGFVCKQ